MPTRTFSCDAAGIRACKDYLTETLEWRGVPRSKVINFQMGLVDSVMNLIDHATTVCEHFTVTLTGDATDIKVNIHAEGLEDWAGLRPLLEKHREPPPPDSVRGRGLSMILHSLPQSDFRAESTVFPKPCFTLRA